jgi:hypothetical protein
MPTASTITATRMPSRWNLRRRRSALLNMVAFSTTAMPALLHTRQPWHTPRANASGTSISSARLLGSQRWVDISPLLVRPGAPPCMDCKETVPGRLCGLGVQTEIPSVGRPSRGDDPTSD